MSYLIKLGSFSKLENSTAQPVTTGWAEYSVVLKDGADYSRPVLTLSADFTTIVPYNYAVFWNRYYFITDKTMIRTGLCQLTLKIDVLATYKTAIGTANLYVLRSASASDGNIRDTYYPIKANNTKYHGVQLPRPVGGVETSIPQGYDSGVVVLNVSGTGTAGASTLIQMLPSAFADLVEALYTNINGFQLTDVISKVVQAFGGNPQTLINSAVWFPFPFDVYDVRQVQIGSWLAVDSNKDPILGGTITDPALLLPDVTFTIPKHPLAATRGAYLNLSPYTMYTLGMPGGGVVNLDNTKLQGETGITIYRTMDAFTGQLFIKVVANSSQQILAYMNGQIGIPITLRGSNNADRLISGAVATIGGVAGAIVSGGAAAITGAVASGIGTALEAVGGTPTTSNMGAGFASISLERVFLDTVCYDIADQDNTHNGRPLCQVRTLNSLSGYIRVSEGDVAIAAPLPEQQEVKRFLESGFFYE